MSNWEWWLWITWCFLFSVRYLRLYHKEHEALSDNPPIHIYANGNKNRLVFKIKDEYKLEYQTPETIKLFGRTKKVIGKTKNIENVTSLEVLKVFLVQCNMVDNQYQQNSEVLFTFTPNKSAFL